MADEVKPEGEVATESPAEEPVKPAAEGDEVAAEQEQAQAEVGAEPEDKQEPPAEEKKGGEEVATEGAQEQVEEQAQGDQPVETPAEPETPRIKPEAYARLLRKSKTRREEIERLNREKAALEARQKELEAEREAAELGKRINAARESGDLTALLDNLGLDVQSINEAFVKHEGKIPVAKPRPEKMLEALVEKKLAEREAAAEAQHQAQMAQARARSIERVAANPAASVLVKLNYAGEVFDYQKATFEQSGKVLTDAEAIEHVVKFVRETVLGEEQPKPEKKPDPKPAAKAAPVKPAAKPTVRTLSSASAPSSAGAKKPRTNEEIEADTIAFLKDFQAGKATG